MSAHSIDYAALAQQARGGGVDYAAMAAQARGAPPPASAVLAGSAPGFKVGMPAPTPPTVSDPPAPSTRMERLFGVDPLADSGQVIGQHLKNLVAGPYHAFTDAPTDEENLREALTGGIGANPISRGLRRMFVSPSEQGIEIFNTQRKAGNTSLTAPEYDAEGNYTPTAASGLMDAIPLAGPWARTIDNDAHKHGAVPALLGLGTDVLAPKGAGKAVSAGLGKIAPALAETALKVRGTDRAYGRTPGQAILDETTGIAPGTIAKQATGRIGELGDQLEKDAAASPNNVDLQPARDAARAAYGAAVERNNPSVIKDMDSLNRQLGSREGSTLQTPVAPAQTTGWGGLYKKQTAMNPPLRIPIPSVVPASEALALKRGIGDLQTSWNPATASDFSSGAVGRVYGKLDKGIDAAVPTSADLNARMSSLSPVAQRATAADLNAGILQRTVDRFKAHTGALAAPLIGAGAGYAHGGVAGGLIGAGAGLVLPEIISSPEIQMTAARTANAAAPLGRILPGPLTALSATTAKKRKKP